MTSFDCITCDGECSLIEKRKNEVNQQFANGDIDIMERDHLLDELRADEPQDDFGVCTQLEAAAVQFAMDYGPLNAARSGDEEARAKMGLLLMTALVENGLSPTPV
jgi:hypothetical protein